MKFSDRLVPVITGVTIALVQSQVAIALSSQEIEQIGKAISVRIVDTQNPFDAGSGIIIKQVGNTYTVITAGHVVKAGKKQIITPDQQTYAIKNIKPLLGLDLAVVEFTSNKKYSVAKIGNSEKVTRNTVVYVVGFPVRTAATPNVDFRFKDGKVDAKASQRDGYDLSYDNRTAKGMSGGAILNEQGELIGIHGRAITEPSEEDPTQSVISGALGTTMDSALRQLLAVGIDLGMRPQTVVTTAPEADDFYLKANQKYGQKDFRGAIADYTAAIRLNPKYVEAYLYRGVTRSELGDQQGAIADYTSAIQIDPKFAYAYNNRGLARSELGDKPGAIADYTTAIQIDPEYARAYNNRGIVRSELGDKPGAIADYTTAIQINPKYAYAYYGRGTSSYELGDKQRAILDLQKAAELLLEQGNIVLYQNAMALIKKYQQ